MKNLKIGLVLMVLVMPISIAAQFKSIAILSPQTIGLSDSILPVVVQGELVSNFSTYSSIEVLDREKLYEQYKELESGIYADNAVEALNDMGNLPATELMMMGQISKVGNNYNLQLKITKTADKTTVAAYSNNVTIENLENLTAIRQASLFLLEKVGVMLTAQTKTTLSGAVETNRVNAQFANARGVVAQRKGTEVEALSYFYQAAALDNSLLEARNQSSVMAVNISSGNIGQDTRNDILWRRDWVNRLTEAEKFFNKVFSENSVPYTLFYSTEIIPGDVNYQTETQHLSINTNLLASGGSNAKTWLSSVEKSLQQVYDGLDATGRKGDWGLSNWPWTSVSNIRPFGNKNTNFNIVAELLGNNGKVIGRKEFSVSGSWGFNGKGRPKIQVIKDEDREVVQFANVKADDISDNLTIKIKSVNGMSAEVVAKNGVLQIKPVSKTMWQNSVAFKIRDGEITAYSGNGGDLVIPSVIWDEQVTSIGEDAFRQKRIKSVRIPNGVVHIFENAFKGNLLTSVSIPGNVRTILDGAFTGNNITSITIGEKVDVSISAFDKNFTEYYYRKEMYSGKGQRAGTYNCYNSNVWTTPKLDTQTLNEGQKLKLEQAGKKRKLGTTLLITGLTVGVTGAVMTALGPTKDRYESYPDENGNKIVSKAKNIPLHRAGVSTIGVGVGIFFIGWIPLLN